MSSLDDFLSSFLEDPEGYKVVADCKDKELVEFIASICCIVLVCEGFAIHFLQPCKVKALVPKEHA